MFTYGIFNTHQSDKPVPSSLKPNGDEAKTSVAAQKIKKTKNKNNKKRLEDPQKKGTPGATFTLKEPLVNLENQPPAAGAPVFISKPLLPGQEKVTSGTPVFISKPFLPGQERATSGAPVFISKPFLPGQEKATTGTPVFISKPFLPGQEKATSGAPTASEEPLFKFEYQPPTANASGSAHFKPISFQMNGTAGASFALKKPLFKFGYRPPTASASGFISKPIPLGDFRFEAQSSVAGTSGLISESISSGDFRCEAEAFVASASGFVSKAISSGQNKGTSHTRCVLKEPSFKFKSKLPTASGFTSKPIPSGDFKFEAQPSAASASWVTSEPIPSGDFKFVFPFGFTFGSRGMGKKTSTENPTPTSRSASMSFKNIGDQHRGKENGRSISISMPSLEDTKPDNPLFKVKPNTLSFGDLAKTTGGDFWFKQKDPHFKGFSRAGEKLFSSLSVSPSKKEDVVPNEVKLITGEEDEQQVYSQCVRLFRFDSVTSQWKERGTGNLKVLKHTTNGKLRVLMRREHVLTVCANHLITATMSLKPMVGSKKAWAWLANDFSDGHCKLEQLAAGFKTPKLAMEFKKMFEECQSLLAGPRKGRRRRRGKLPKEETKSDEKDKEGPVVPLQKEEIKCDEGVEIILFQERIGLSCWDRDQVQWKERGVGDIKILFHSTKHLYLILMTRELLLTVCVNHTISQEMELRPMNSLANALVWTALDYADGEGRVEQLVAKFRTPELADSFRKTFCECQRRIGLEDPGPWTLRLDAPVQETPEPKALDQETPEPKASHQGTQKTGDQETPELLALDQESPVPLAVDQETPEPLAVDQETPEPQTLDQETLEPQTLDQETPEPQILDEEAPQPQDLGQEATTPQVLVLDSSEEQNSQQEIVEPQDLEKETELESSIPQEQAQSMSPISIAPIDPSTKKTSEPESIPQEQSKEPKSISSTPTDLSTKKSSEPDSATQNSTFDFDLKTIGISLAKYICDSLAKLQL